MSLSELLVLTFAVWQIIEIWHHSDICATPRAVCETWELSDGAVTQFCGRLLACPFCLSIWVSWLVVGLWWLDLFVLRLVLGGFAVARAANLGSDLTRRWNRTPKHGKLHVDEEREDAVHDVKSAFENEPQDGTSTRPTADVRPTREFLDELLRPGTAADDPGGP